MSAQDDTPAIPMEATPLVSLQLDKAVDDRQNDASIIAPNPAPAGDPTDTKTSQTPLPPQLPPHITKEEIIDYLISFLSTADSQALGAVFFGLSAATYMIFGRLGLILIGAVGGVVLTISWERKHADVSRAIRGEKSIEILERLLETSAIHGSRRSVVARTMDVLDDNREIISSFDDFQPETARALNNFIDAIVRDYVKWWYSPLVPADQAFPLACRNTLTNFVLSISQHLSRKRPADAFIDMLTNCSSMIIVFFTELSNAFADIPGDSSMTAADAIYNYLAANPDSNLASLLSQKSQASKFRMISEDILAFLDRAAYDCDPARVFLREILAGVILEMILQMCSKPEWINSWIVYLLEAGEPNFNQALDAGMKTGTDFAELDGNIGHVSTSRQTRRSTDTDKHRSYGHGRKLSRADEETEEAVRQINEMFKKEAKLHRENEPPLQSSNMECRAKESGKCGNSISSSIPPEISPSQHSSSHEWRGESEDKHTSESLHQFSLIDTFDPTPHTGIASPISPASPANQIPPAPTGPFTSFDQFVPQNRLQIEEEDETVKPPPLTLHNANITIYEDGETEQSNIRNKPNWDYLVQVEPVSTIHPGWMIVRKYSDFELLHETLSRIAKISGALVFVENHGMLPHWKEHTRESLRAELERYIRNACSHQSLAQSGGMKRFFEKADQGHGRNQSKNGFGGIETFGKNMLGALTSAPKGAFEGSKAMVGGMTGVFGNIGGLVQKKNPGTPASARVQPLSLTTNRNSMPTIPRLDSLSTVSANNVRSRDSLDSQRSSIISVQPALTPPMDRRPSYNSQLESDRPDEALKPTTTEDLGRRSPLSRGSLDLSQTFSSLGQLQSPSTSSLDGICSNTEALPKPDYSGEEYSPISSQPPSRMDSIVSRHEGIPSATTTFSSPPRTFSETTAASEAIFHGNGNNTQKASTLNGDHPSSSNSGSTSSKQQTTRCKKQYPPLSEYETRVAVELVFAMINELYTLSSAWNIRRTLLAAAKSFLLRPGNPSLTSIQRMIQDNLLDVLSSDEGLARQVEKTRSNALPTEEERAKWPAETATPEEKEKQRIRARKLLIESGMPAALTGVMGAAATQEALGRVFDALQIEEVARGLVFGVMLQALRIVTH